ncbi:hypothetical protein BP5796_08454 [Coleophoma crateriformis]|uniref:Uncharacterized protein n=1 Tax=Coleophoma crateriformis TaxID=565419 RepID=A0A3D8R7Q1_9HELO|nr:hypothetical protein BP5796_08454 [Coleophoma crateriformis]
MLKKLIADPCAAPGAQGGRREGPDGAEAAQGVKAPKPHHTRIGQWPWVSNDRSATTCSSHTLVSSARHYNGASCIEPPALSARLKGGEAEADYMLEIPAEGGDSTA